VGVIYVHPKFPGGNLRGTGHWLPGFVCTPTPKWVLDKRRKNRGKGKTGQQNKKKKRKEEER
jgi:hypothetical protein